MAPSTSAEVGADRLWSLCRDSTLIAVRAIVMRPPGCPSFVTNWAGLGRRELDREPDGATCWQTGVTSPPPVLDPDLEDGSAMSWTTGHSLCIVHQGTSTPPRPVECPVIRPPGLVGDETRWLQAWFETRIVERALGRYYARCLSGWGSSCRMACIAS